MSEIIAKTIEMLIDIETKLASTESNCKSSLPSPIINNCNVYSSSKFRPNTLIEQTKQNPNF